MNHEYTPEEVKEVEARVAKANEYLKENELTPAAISSMVNIGNTEVPDVFAVRVQPFLRDTKYQSKPEPVVAEKTSNEVPATN